MGRPRASSDVREFAAMFANTVTAYSPSRYDWVARTGRHSLFVLMTRLASKVLNVDFLEVIWPFETQRFTGDSVKKM
jgi:hypothetical protein